LSVVDGGGIPGLIKPKTIYQIGICCFSAELAVLRSKQVVSASG